MAIDDPVGIEIRQVKDEIEAESSLPMQLTKLGLSCALAAALAPWPLVSQIMVSLITSSSGRSEKRFLRVAEALNEQYKQIEEKIPDATYYESEEFQTLMGLVIERLHTTCDDEKLKMFGNALANSGSSEFQTDHREDFIRILRDLGTADLDELKTFAPPSPSRFGGELDANQRFQMCHSRQDLAGESLSRTTRLIGLGLVNENLSMKEFTGSVEYHSASEARRAISDYLKQPPKRSYRLSPFGWRFLQFISGAASADKDSRIPEDGR
jgi:hypothetical protein